jgi:hypothetical protein
MQRRLNAERHSFFMEVIQMPRLTLTQDDICRAMFEYAAKYELLDIAKVDKESVSVGVKIHSTEDMIGWLDYSPK